MKLTNRIMRHILNNNIPSEGNKPIKQKQSPIKPKSKIKPKQVYQFKELQESDSYISNNPEIKLEENLLNQNENKGRNYKSNMNSNIISINNKSNKKINNEHETYMKMKLKLLDEISSKRK